MTKVCPNCGKEFKTPPSRAEKLCCTRKCSDARTKSLSTCVVRCQYIACGKLFIAKTYAHRRFCSGLCANRSRGYKVAVRCCVCGKVTYAIYSRRNTTKYCSVTCLGKAKRVVKWPTAHQLVAFLLKITVPDIARIYSVDPSTVRYWCRALGVVVPPARELDKRDYNCAPRLTNERKFRREDQDD